MNQYIQNIFYHFILSEFGLAQKVEPDFFDSTNLQICFQFAKEYVIKYHSAPTANQLKELVKAGNASEQVTDDIIDILYNAEKSVKDYTHDWLYDNATSWAQWKNFVKSLSSTIAYVKLNQDNVTVDNVKDIMEHAKGGFNRSCIIEFNADDKEGSDFWNAESHKQVQLVRSSTGYSFLDLCLDGGTFPGCLVCFVGAPKIGKSLWLQNLCAESVKKGENNAYITLELPEEMINQRIGANMFSIPALDYKNYTADTAAFKERMSAFKKNCMVPPGQLIVKSFPTSSMSVLDLESWLLNKEEELSTETKKFKFKNIFIDYINIMRNYRNPNSENTYMKIKQLAEDVKAMGLKHGWAIITATQANRSQYDTTDMTGSQVAESAGLAATVDVMFGIIADSMMKAQGHYYIKCLFDRVSPQDNKRKLFLLDKEYLRITEDLASPIEEVYSTFAGTSQNYQQNYQRKPQQPMQQVQAVQQGEFELSHSLFTAVPMLSNTLEPVGSTAPDKPKDIFSGHIGVTGAGLFD